MAEATHSDELRQTTDLDVWRLLPWLANDTLEGEELDRVLDHLKESVECRRELLFLSELRHATELASDARLQPSPARLDRLMARIDRYEEARRPRTQPAETPASVALSTNGEGKDRRTARSRWLPVAQAAVLTALVGALMWTLISDRPAARVTGEAPAFRTLSDDGLSDDRLSDDRLSDDAASRADEADDRGSRLRLVFEDGVEERHVRRLLLDAGAEIVAGPTALGVYTVELSQDSEDERDGLVEILRADPRVAFVEIVIVERVTGRETAP